ncbi:unnamed protein product, partial [Tetraodon nigroviridis]
EESSDSDGEQEETSHKLIRKVSTSGQIRAKVGTPGPAPHRPVPPPTASAASAPDQGRVQRSNS